MIFFIASFGVGPEIELKNILGKRTKVAYISNARDYLIDGCVRTSKQNKDVDDLVSLGLLVDIVDLKDYFYNKKDLYNKLDDYQIIWVGGGNVFVLRKAMQLSHFDEYLMDNLCSDTVYGGYSAGVCVLSSNMEMLNNIDDIYVNTSYYSSDVVVLNGLELIDSLIVPHYMSAHIESPSANKLVDELIKNNVKYTAMKDGEFFITEILNSSN